jgi:uncharacterized C2H2 Zn-finger protein
VTTEVADLDAENQSMKGVIAEVGLERDEDQFNSFNITISMVLKSGKALTYDKGEQLMRQFRKELLGKEVEITAIVFTCPTCGKGFNTEPGVRQHVRMAHKKERKTKEDKPQKTKEKAKKKRKKPAKASKAPSKK